MSLTTFSLQTVVGEFEFEATLSIRSSSRAVIGSASFCHSDRLVICSLRQQGGLHREQEAGQERAEQDRRLSSRIFVLPAPIVAKKAPANCCTAFVRAYYQRQSVSEQIKQRHSSRQTQQADHNFGQNTKSTKRRTAQ
jgi:hypothetical protein